MKILLFGISNVGKSTIGKRLSEKLNYDFDDVDDEIKRRYGIIDKFQAKYASYRERHIEKGKILEELVNKYGLQPSIRDYLRPIKRKIQSLLWKF